MRSTSLLLCAALASCSSLQSTDFDQQSRQGYTHQLTAQAGARSFQDGGIWDPVKQQTSLGLEYSRTRNKDGLGFELGLLGSFGIDDSEFGDRNVVSVAGEFYGGVRKGFSFGDLSPYVGAGATLLHADIDNDSGNGVPDNNDTSLGLYLHGGATYPVTEMTSIGLDLRYVGATDVSIDPVSGDADYLQALFVVAMKL